MISLSSSTIDQSGVAYSDYRAYLENGVLIPAPKEGDGWVKGWLLDTPSQDIVIVAKHCGASAAPPTNLIRLYQQGGRKSATRNIIGVELLDCPMGTERSPGDRRGGDIAICRVDSAFPLWAKSYKLAVDPKNGSLVHTITQRGISSAKISFNKDPWVSTPGRKPWLEAGDSGLPWFIEEEGEWRVVSHSTKGYWGEGPLYSHKNIKKEIIKSVKALGKITK